MKETYLIGAGGHARVLKELLSCNEVKIDGYVVENRGVARNGDANVVGDDDWLGHQAAFADEIQLVMGIGSPLTLRQSRQKHFESIGFSFPNLVHPKASVSDDVEFGTGVQILAGAVIEPGVHLSSGVIVNSGAVVCHDSRVGEFAHVAPRACLCGQVRVGCMSLIGAGSTIRPGLLIGSNSTVGVGSVVTRNVGDNLVVFGCPAVER